MGRKCSVYGCKSGYLNDSYDGSVYSFPPKGSPERKIWVLSLPNKIELEGVTDQMGVCGLHFPMNCKMKKKSHFGHFGGPKWGFSGPWGPTMCMPLYDYVIKFPQFISKSKSYIVFTILDAFLGRNWRKKAFWAILGPKMGLFRTVGPNYMYAVV